MTENRSHNQETMSKETDENSGQRTAAIHTDPSISLEEGQNAAAGEGPNAAGGPAPSSAEDYIPSRSDPAPSNLPSTDHPVPDDAENPDEDTLGSSESFSDKTDDRYAH
jgi:hypothetical protein